MTERGVVGLGVMGWLNRLIARVLPVLAGSLVFLFALTTARHSPFVLATGEANFGWPDNHWFWPTVTVLAAASGVAAALGNRWRWPLFILAVVGWLAFSAWATVIVASYYAAVRLRGRRDSLIFLATALALVLGPFFIGAWDSEPGQRELMLFVAVALASVLVLLPYIAGLWVKARRQVLVGLQDRARALELDQAVRAEQARTEERERIAREMHDVLAHRVSLMVLHAGALEVSGAGDRVAEEAALIRTTGRAALTELRQVLGVLRSRAAHGMVERLDAGDSTPSTLETVLAPQPVLSDVDRLLDEAAKAGLAITRTSEGVPHDLPVTAQRAAFRVIQEALTNVVKHAPGAATKVTLRWSADALELLVDNGPSAHPVEPMPAGGFGLIGLRERVELLRGRFEARRRLDGGFLVHAVIPAAVVEVVA